MLTHSFDRFYVVTKFEMPKIDDLKLTTFTFDFACKHLMSDKTFMQKIFKTLSKNSFYVRLYQKQVQYCNQTAYNILQNEINLILPTLNEPNRKKRFSSVVLDTVASKIIGIAFKGIFSFSHHKIYHLEDTMIMYGKYN